jgi:hypothetical protein
MDLPATPAQIGLSIAVCELASRIMERSREFTWENPGKNPDGKDEGFVDERVVNGEVVGFTDTGERVGTKVVGLTVFGERDGLTVVGLTVLGFTVTGERDGFTVVGLIVAGFTVEAHSG